MAQARPQAVRAAALISLLVGSLLLGGCWDTAELNDRGIVSTIGIDRVADGRYSAWFQVLQPVQIGGSSGRGPTIPTTLIHGEGATVEEAVRAAQLKYTPRLYLGHLQILVIHERVAREGVRPVVEWLNQSLDRRLSQILMITRSPIHEMLEVISPMSLRSMSVVRESLGTKIGGSTTLGAWYEDYAEAGREPVLGIFAPLYQKGQVVRQDESRYEGMALFHQDKMVSQLPATDSIPFLMLNADLTSGPAVQGAYVNHGHQRVTITWRQAKVKRRVEVSGGRVRYRVSFTVRGRLSQPPRGGVPYRMEDVREAEQAVAQALVQRMRTVFTKLQAAQVDSIGVGQVLHGSNVRYWRQVRKGWNEQGFPKVELVITPQVKIIDEGLVKNHFGSTDNQEEEFGSKPPQPKPTR